ncbi:hypothetical protein ACWEKJ_18555 [Amycolatopsis thermoflava]
MAPGSIASGLCTNLGLDIPTLTLTGGCSTALGGFELASMVARGEVKYAVVADTILEPLYLSATGYAGRSGHRASSIPDDPADVRPHDTVQAGNAPAEGAAAAVLTSIRHPAARETGVEFIGFSSRNGGGNSCRRRGAHAVLAGSVLRPPARRGRGAPTANLVNPYPRLPARALAGSSERIADNGRRTAMTVGLSGGGDTTSLLLRLA